jgi:hypothetical protein
MGLWSWKTRWCMVMIAMGCNSPFADARLFHYPQQRYVSPLSESVGGGVLPLQDEVGNVLMNNPAALARFKGYRFEPVNLGLNVNSEYLSNAFESHTLGKYTLGGISSLMTQNVDTIYGFGYQNMTAFSYGNWAFGLLYQEHSRAVSDGTNLEYQAINQVVPTIGFGFGMARNVIRVGYSLQYVNQTSGTATVAASDSAAFFSGLARGSGLSHNVSINFALPYTYLPSFSIMARNLGGLVFSGSRLIPRGTNFQGSIPSEPMSVDIAMDYLFKVAADFRIKWYLEYRDMTNQSSFSSFADRFSTGFDIPLSKSFGIRGGMQGIANFSYGLGYRGEFGELGLSIYQEKNGLTTGPSWDQKYAIQFKIKAFEQAKKSEDGLQEVGNKR